MHTEANVIVQEALRSNYLFRGLTDAQTSELLELVQDRAFEGGDVIIRQFDKNRDLMIVLDGGARIKTFSGETLSEVGAGGVLGEISLLDEQPRSATVVSVGKSLVAVIPSAKIHALMDRDCDLKAQLLYNIGRLLCQRLRVATVQLDGALTTAALI